MIRYDNLKSAVKQVLRGRRRVETDRFVALRSHYLFESLFTHAGHARARTRRAASRARSAASAAATGPGPGRRRPRRAQRAARGRLRGGPGARGSTGAPGTVGEAWAAERPLLRALPAEAFDATETAAPRVDSKALVTVRQNRYSVPVALAGLRVSARIGAREITICHGGRRRRAPRAAARALRDQRAARSLPRAAAAQARRRWRARWRLRQQRERGAWPACSTSCGRRSPIATGARRPRGRWSTS